MGLTAATYLGGNTVPILDALVRSMRADGIEIDVDMSSGGSSADARTNAADIDLVWMCGSLAMVLIDEGALNHDVTAAPVFAGQREPVYHSVIIAHRDGPDSIEDARAGSLGVNEPESWSGHHGLRRHLGDHWFAAEVATGSHRGSIESVAARRCDVAGIDVTVWEHVSAAEPGAVKDLRVIDRTPDWPAPPFLVSSPAGHLTDALRAAVPAGLDRIVRTDAARYRELRP